MSEATETLAEKEYKTPIYIRTATLKYAREHPEKIKEFHKGYYEANKEKVNQQKKEYYQRNKEKLNARRMENYRKQKAKELEEIKALDPNAVI